MLDEQDSRTLEKIRSGVSGLGELVLGAFSLKFSNSIEEASLQFLRVRLDEFDDSILETVVSYVGQYGGAVASAALAATGACLIIKGTYDVIKSSNLR